MHTTTSFLLVFLGSGAGGMLRHAAGLTVSKLAPAIAFPFATLTVNIAGCFVMGVLLGHWGLLSPQPTAPREEIRVLLLIGVLGGFTTFSSFGRDFLELLRSGQTARAALYVLLSVVLSLVAVLAGHTLGARVNT